MTPFPRHVLAVIMALLGVWLLVMNAGAVAVSWRNKRHGIDRHVSTVTPVPQLLFGLAWLLSPELSGALLLAGALADAGLWTIVLGLARMLPRWLRLTIVFVMGTFVVLPLILVGGTLGYLWFDLPEVSPAPAAPAAYTAFVWALDGDGSVMPTEPRTYWYFGRGLGEQFHRFPQAKQGRQESVCVYATKLLNPAAKHRALGRALSEVLLNAKLTATWTPAECISIYAERGYFGNGLTGLEAAAMAYFGKPAIDLTVEQSALLAGLHRAPNRDEPWCHGARALVRANQVLREYAREYSRPVTELTDLSALRLLPKPSSLECP
jgi:hypothetical protein